MVFFPGWYSMRRSSGRNVPVPSSLPSTLAMASVTKSTPGGHVLSANCLSWTKILGLARASVGRSWWGSKMNIEFGRMVMVWNGFHSEWGVQFCFTQILVFEHVCLLIFFSGCTIMSQLGNVSSFTNKVPAPRATFYRTTTGSCNLSASAKTTITYMSTENVTRWTQKVKWTFDTPLHRNYACLLLKISVSFLPFFCCKKGNVEVVLFY